MEKKSELNGFLEKIQIFDRCTLKLIAVVSMVIDHVGAVLFENALWMRCVGRLAMPIFCFFVAEGFYYSRSRYNYLLRMGLFALISEIPFDFAFYDGKLFWGHQNVMWTFFLAIAAMLAFSEITLKVDGKKGRLLGALCVFSICMAAVFLRTDYNAFGVAMVFLFYILKENGLLMQNIGALIYQLIARGQGIQAWAMFSAVPLMMYNGKKGRPLKWFFYCFYPGHLIVLWIIKNFMIQ